MEPGRAYASLALSALTYLQSRVGSMTVATSDIVVGNGYVQALKVIAKARAR
jgi:hypothetical protein